MPTNVLMAYTFINQCKPVSLIKTILFEKIFRLVQKCSTPPLQKKTTSETSQVKFIKSLFMERQITERIELNYFLIFVSSLFAKKSE